MADQEECNDSITNSVTTSKDLPKKSNISYRPIAENEFKVYKWRWYMVLVVCLINMANALIWICFSPITSITTEYYGISSWQVNWLSLIFVVVSIPFGFTASWLIDTLGLRTSIILAAWLNVIGSLLRNLTTVDSIIPHKDRFPVLLTGQFLAAVAQPFVMFCPTKLAALWFSHSQRAIANTVTSMANPLGILIANLMSPRMVTTASEMPVMLWTCTGFAGVGCILATFGVCSSIPPSPPTSSAAESSEPFLAGLKKIIRIKTYWVLLIVFGTGLALFTSVTTFIQQILCPRGYNNDFSGLCGALMIGLGVVGAATAGIICDKTKRFEEVTKISFALTVAFGILFLEIARFRDMEVHIAVVISLVGLFGFAIYPICMELAVEVTYPVAEATSSGLLIISGQVQSIIFMLVAQELLQPLPLDEVNLPTGCVTNGTHVTAEFIPQDWTVSTLFLFGVGAAASVFLIVFFRPSYRRLRAEDIARAEALLNYEIIIDST
ncbi:solute carrier family 49 member A3-like [Gigantopelta aegis]|uniref:solute carrier family 49 member A3-like n=1 Tax=Gigantopelta aegis TaxID=1735272 RepID=UPI001B88E2F6|nr:solute carrier family 49 member A3-like [Gigantopelta aegis]